MGVEIRANPQRGVTNSFQADVVEFLNSETVTSVVRGVAPFFRFVAPIASVAIGAFSNLYLVLDPATSLLFVGCAALVNTFVLNYSHDWIQSRWSDHWKATYPISTLEAGILSDDELRSREAERLREIETVPPGAQLPQTVEEIAQGLSTRLRNIQPPTSSPQSLKLAEDEFKEEKERYESVLKELNNSVEERKKLKREIDSLRYGTTGAWQTLKTQSSKKEEEMLELAKKKQEDIIKLLSYRHLFNSDSNIKANLDDIGEKVPLFLDSKTDAEKNIKNAEKILSIDLKDLCQNLRNLFGKMRDETNRISNGTFFVNQQDLQSLQGRIKISLNTKENDKSILEKECAEYRSKRKFYSNKITVLVEQLNTLSTGETTKTQNEINNSLDEKMEKYRELQNNSIVFQKIRRDPDGEGMPKNSYICSPLIDLEEKKKTQSDFIKNKKKEREDFLKKLNNSQMVFLKNRMDSYLKLCLADFNKASTSLKSQKPVWKDHQKDYEICNDMATQHNPGFKNAINSVGAVLNPKDTFLEHISIADRKTTFHLDLNSLNEDHALCEEAINILDSFCRKQTDLAQKRGGLSSTNADNRQFKAPENPVDSYVVQLSTKTTLDNELLANSDETLKPPRPKETSENRKPDFSREITSTRTSYELPEDLPNSRTSKLPKNNKPSIQSAEELRNEVEKAKAKAKPEEMRKKMEAEPFLKIVREEKALENELNQMQEASEYIKKEHLRLTQLAADFWRQEIVPLQAQLEMSLKETTSIELIKEEKKNAEHEIITIDNEIEKNQKETGNIKKSIGSLAEDFVLLGNYISIFPVESDFQNIDKRVDINSRFSLILKEYRQVKEDLRTEASKSDGPILKTKENDLELASLEVQRLRDQEEKIFGDLVRKKNKLDEEKINVLRGLRYQTICSRAKKMMEFYTDKPKRESSAIVSGSGSVLRDDIQKLSRDILEQKIVIAAQRLQGASFFLDRNKESARLEMEKQSSLALINRARLNLAEHRLRRYQLEQQQRISKTLFKEVLIEAIEKEQELVLAYFLSRYSSSALVSKVPNDVRANLALINLVLDAVRVDISDRDSENLKQFNFCTKVKERLEAAFKTEVAQAFHEAAYSKMGQKQQDSSGMLQRIWSYSSFTLQSEKKDGSIKIIGNDFIINVIKDLEEGNKNSFICQIKNLANSYSFNDSEYAIKIIINKILMIDLSLKKSVLMSGDSFDNNINILRSEKYNIKNGSANFVLNRASNKEQFKTARNNLTANQKAQHSYQTAQDEYQDSIREVLEKEREANTDTLTRGRNALRAVLQEEAESARISKNQKQGRNQAMANYGWLEKLTYLIPAAAIWAFYRFSPLLNMISLSFRVSQNILLIGSATHLFVRSFFSELEARPSLDDPQQRQAVRALRN